jgi:prepilin-type N-terminal cleavage/methylation domain-containing protein
MTTSVTGKRAVTFIELLFVIVIIGILVGISLPNFKKTFNSLELNTFARELQTFMNYLNQRAIVERKIIYLNIDGEKKEYWAQFKDAQERLKSYPIPEELKIEAAQMQIIFYPDGTIDQVNLKIINRDSQCVNLTTRGLYGGVKLQTQ